MKPCLRAVMIRASLPRCPRAVHSPKSSLSLYIESITSTMITRREIRRLNAHVTSLRNLEALMVSSRVLIALTIQTEQKVSMLLLSKRGRHTMAEMSSLLPRSRVSVKSFARTLTIRSIGSCSSLPLCLAL